MKVSKREYKLFEGDRWLVNLEGLLTNLTDEINKQEDLTTHTWRMPNDWGGGLVADIYLVTSGKRSENRIGEIIANNGMVYSIDETFTLDKFLQDYEADKYTGKRIIKDLKGGEKR